MTSGKTEILDPPTRARFRLLYPDVAVRARRLYLDFQRLHARILRCTEAMRTLAYQEELYAQGRTAPGPVVTHSLPGYSFHHYGCALDTCFKGTDPYLDQTPGADELWGEFGRLSRSHGFVWGGDWPDPKTDLPHLQLTYGLDIEQVRGRYKYGGLEAVWSAFDSIRGVPQGQDWYGPQARAKLLETGVEVP